MVPSYTVGFSKPKLRTASYRTVRFFKTKIRIAPHRRILQIEKPHRGPVLRGKNVLFFSKLPRGSIPFYCRIIIAWDCGTSFLGSMQHHNLDRRSITIAGVALAWRQELFCPSATPCYTGWAETLYLSRWLLGQQTESTNWLLKFN